MDLIVCANPSSSWWLWAGEGFFWYWLILLVPDNGLLNVCVCAKFLTRIHTFNGPLSRTTRVGRYQKGKTNLDFTEVRDSECQWYQLGHMQVCISLPTENHASTPPLSFLQAGCPSCCPTNSVKALKAFSYKNSAHLILFDITCFLIVLLTL